MNAKENIGPAQLIADYKRAYQDAYRKEIGLTYAGRGWYRFDESRRCFRAKEIADFRDTLAAKAATRV